MQRIISVGAVAGLLAIGLAACGDSPTEPTAATSPTPTVAAPPDDESCTQANTLALVAGLRMVGVALALETAGAKDAAEKMADVVEQSAQATAKVTDPRVKAVVDEYATLIDDLKKQLETAGGDPAKLQNDVDITLGKFEKAEEKLSALCADKSPQPDAKPAGLAAGCQSFETASMSLMDPMIELSTAVETKSGIDAAVKKALNGFDTFIAELKKISAQAAAGEFKTALTGAVTEVETVRASLVAAGKDPAKLKALIDSESESPAMEKIATLCAGAK